VPAEEEQAETGGATEEAEIQDKEEEPSPAPETEEPVPAGVRTSVLETELLEEQREERFIIADILGELLEDNY
jgi:hypothetical protein